MLVCPLCRLALGPTETACPRDGQQGVQARQVDVPAGIRARFAIVEPFAQGQSGDLFIADDQQTGRRGVLKLLLLPESVTPAERNRLKRELVKQATLAHPVLCLPLATGDANGVAWIFRELRDGVSLRVRLARSGALPPSEALAVAAQLASALDELHRSGLLHRDIKPGHVLLEPQPSGLPRVSLIDAGIAARIDAGAVFDLQGTAEYVSPEQAQGKLVSFRSDLYALGCLLHEMLSGQPPFTGDVKSVLEAHVSSLPPASSATVPTGVTTLLAQLLAKEPRDRPFSAQQVRRALEPFLPEDAGTRREATQAFEKTAEKPDHTAAENPVEPSSPKAGTGTLRPPGKSIPPPPPAGATGKKGASVPPPPAKAAPKPDSTNELSPLDLEGAEIEAPKVPAKTLMGFAARPTGQGTEELSPLDLEQAEAALAPKPASSTLLGMPAQPPPEGLDYDDLAETKALDRDKHVEPLDLAPAPLPAPPPEPAFAPAGMIPAPMPAMPTPAPTPAVVATPRKKGRFGVVAVLAFFALGGLCFAFAVTGGAAVWVMQEGELASIDFEPPDVELPQLEPAPFEPAPFEPAPIPSIPPPPVAVQPAPMPEPEPPPPVAVQPEPPPPAPPPPVAVEPEPPPAPVAAAEPARPEPARPEPRPEPVRPEPRPQPARPEPRAERPAPAPPAPAPAPAGRRFDQLREEARAHFAARRFQEAAAAYEQATSLNPRHAGSFAGLGASYLAMGDTRRAVGAYQRAIMLSPNTAGYHSALGRAYMEAGQRDNARAAYRRALQLDPNNQAARGALQQLGG